MSKDYNAKERHAGPSGPVHGLVRSHAIRRVGTLTVAVLALFLCTQASAWAAGPEWRVNDTALTESTGTEWSGKIKVADSNAPGGAVTVECEDSAEGPVGPGKAGEITKWTASKCVFVKKGACETGSTPTVEAVNLPWHTELVTVEGATRDSITNGGKGAPGYQRTCRVLGLKVPDICTGTLSATVADGESGVTATLLGSEKLSCTQTKEGTGSTEGSQNVKAPAGKLSAVTTGAEWFVNGVKPGEPKKVKSAGKTSLFDVNTASLRVNCEDATEGTVGLGNAGEVTKWTTSKCLLVERGSCETSSTPTVEAVNLPWRTELLNVEGTIREVMLGSSKSTPAGFKMKCKLGALEETDTCTGAVSSTATNSETAFVKTQFLTSEKLKCVNNEGHESKAGELSGELKFETLSGEALEVKLT